ncbi:hypothetical protein [Agrobacterium sp. lyk4-40-TYG-31]|uniref:hypothetical protein n=1 Tax=Agrobacterium sp. lyk4-40-TYG-31 TaxID=3040276 RepID=UPI00254A40C4|nr:hypothetical protein [Agrobacterium sp. lyk4-40-TYG-31]
MPTKPNGPQLRGEIYDIVRVFRLELDRRTVDMPLSEKVALSGSVDAMRIVIRNRNARSRFFTVEELDYLEQEAARFISIVTRSQVAERLIERNILEEDGRTVTGQETHNWFSLAEKLRDVLRGIPASIIQPIEDFEFVQGNLPLLSDIVPDQKVSPVHFDIKNDKLILTHLRANSRPEDSQNVHRARSTLIESGQKIIEELRQSNCDRRFLEDVIAVQTRLESTHDIVQLGILNIACEEQRREFEPELPRLLAGKLRAHFSNIAMYVAQFPEWLRYAENALEVELSAADIRRSQDIANEIAEKFEAVPAKVDADVPRTLRAISDAISHPATAARRVAFALVRTLENLFIRVFSHVGKFFDDVASQSLSKSAKIGSSAVAISFGSMILGYATNLAAIYEKVPGMAWLKTAVEIFTNALPAFSL